MARAAQSWKTIALFWVLVSFIAVTFLLGGGSRADIQSLVILRPLAVIVCGVGLWSLSWDHVRTHRFLFAMAGGIYLFVALHLIPMPPALWGLLPGREIVAEIDRVAELGVVWRPISMVPAATWNALFALFVPLAVLILGVQLSRDQLFQLLPVILALGLLSGFWGLLQAIGPADGPLYLYRITNHGAAVGLFSNRNHQAILLACLFPMLAVFASAGVQSGDGAKFKGGIALAAGAVLVPLLLVTGSRAGLAAGVLGLLSVLVLYRKPIITVAKKRKTATFDARVLIGAAAVFGLGAMTVLMARAEAFLRLAAPDQTEELRFQIWGPITDMAWKYFPIGSGVGSFVEVYQIDEPNGMLGLSYVNHAHNDWLELFMTAGLPGLVILGIAIVAYVRAAMSLVQAKRETSRGILFAKLGAVIVTILALGSIADYPLRVPSLSAVLMIAILWMAEGRRRLSNNAGSR